MRFTTKVTILTPPEVTYRFEGDTKGSAAALPLLTGTLFSTSSERPCESGSSVSDAFQNRQRFRGPL